MYDGQVTYKVRDEYPAVHSIDDIQRRMTALGWKIRERDFLNPGGSSATKAEWTETRQIEGTEVTSWSQQWESPVGDVAWFGLQYSQQVEGHPSGPLQVIVSYFKSETVEAVQSATEPGRN